jgi:hypothetical protein
MYFDFLLENLDVLAMLCSDVTASCVRQLFVGCSGGGGEGGGGEVSVGAGVLPQVAVPTLHVLVSAQEVPPAPVQFM